MRPAKTCLPRLLVALLPLLFTGCALSPATREARFAARLDKILDRLADTGAIYTARVLELPSRHELYAHGCDAPFTPASNMKVLVSSTALDTFGLDRTFATYLVLDGDDLWIVGTGDPGLGDIRLARRRGSYMTGVLDEWADALRQHGVTHIRGKLYHYDGELDRDWLHPTWGDSTLHWYGAPIAGLTFNDNCVDITVFPTEPGELARYTLVPAVQNVTVVNECRTAEKHDPTIEKLPGSNTYKLGGTCAKKEELKSKPVEDPGAFLADALRTRLAESGITIDGASERAAAPPGGRLPPEPGKVVAVHATRLRDILDRINTNSQNLFADVMCKLAGQAYATGQFHAASNDQEASGASASAVATRAAGAGSDLPAGGSTARDKQHVPGSWADGERAIRAFLAKNDINDAQLIVADGSGLSAKNKVTARLMTDLFAVMLERPDRMIFLDTLAKGGINGTLEKRFAGYEGRVFAKTGQIGGVRALSGYAKTNRGAWLAFSIIYNRIPGDVEPYEALQDEAVRLMIQWPDIR